MLEALIAGERDPKALAELARGRMRRKTRQLTDALTGHIDDHHAVLCQMMLDRIDTLSAQIATLTGTIEQAIAPFARQVAHLDAVTGIGPTAAQERIAELGVDMTRFPTADHLVAWARYCPRPASQPARRARPPPARATLAGRHPGRDRHRRRPH
jgi:transposase